MESEIATLERLYARYLDATASQAEEQELRTRLRHIPREALTPRLRLAERMFCGFDALHAEQMPLRARRHPRWPVVAAVGTGIAATIALGLFLSLRPTVYGYIDGRPITDSSEAMAETIYFEQLDELSQSFEIADKIFGDTQK